VAFALSLVQATHFPDPTDPKDNPHFTEHLSEQPQPQHKRRKFN